MILALNCLELGSTITLKTQTSFLHIMFYFYDIHVWSVVMIKSSLAFMLLRFHQERAWRTSLYTLLSVQVMIACASTLINYLRCMPLQRAWNGQRIEGQCMSEQGMKIWMWTICGKSVYFLKHAIPSCSQSFTSISCDAKTL